MRATIRFEAEVSRASIVFWEISDESKSGRDRDQAAFRLGSDSYFLAASGLLTNRAIAGKPVFSESAADGRQSAPRRDAISSQNERAFGLDTEWNRIQFDNVPMAQ